MNIYFLWYLSWVGCPSPAGHVTPPCPTAGRWSVGPTPVAEWWVQRLSSADSSDGNTNSHFYISSLFLDVAASCLLVSDENLWIQFSFQTWEQTSVWVLIPKGTRGNINSLAVWKTEKEKLSRSIYRAAFKVFDTGDLKPIKHWMKADIKMTERSFQAAEQTSHPLAFCSLMNKDEGIKTEKLWLQGQKEVLRNPFHIWKT